MAEAKWVDWWSSLLRNQSMNASWSAHNSLWELIAAPTAFHLFLAPPALGSGPPLRSFVFSSPLPLSLEEKEGRSRKNKTNSLSFLALISFMEWLLLFALLGGAIGGATAHNPTNSQTTPLHFFNQRERRCLQPSLSSLFFQSNQFMNLIWWRKGRKARRAGPMAFTSLLFQSQFSFSKRIVEWKEGSEWPGRSSSLCGIICFAFTKPNSALRFARITVIIFFLI